MNIDGFVNKRKQQQQRTVENIRSAVDKLVAEKGFEATTIRDICQEAGIKTGGFYHHFSCKDELLFDRYHRTNQYFNSYYETDLKDKKCIEALKLLVKEYMAYLKSRVLLVMIQYNKTQINNLHQWEEREPNACLLIIRELISKGQKTGEIRSDRESKDLVAFLWSLVTGATQCYCTSGGSFLNEFKVEQLIYHWIDSLKA